MDSLRTREQDAPASTIRDVVAELTAEAVWLSAAVGRRVRGEARHCAAGLQRIWADAGVAAALGVLTAAAAVWLFGRMNTPIITQVGDIWFGGDTPRIVAENLSRLAPEHLRTSVHPLWALLVSAPFDVLSAFGLSVLRESQALVALSAFAFAAAFYGAVRTAGLDRLQSIGATALAAVSSSAMFWLSVPETYGLSATSMLVTLMWLGAPRGAHDRWSAPLQSIVSLSITVTNWTAGIIAATLGLGVRRAFAVSAIAFLVVSVLVILQQNLFPGAGKFLSLQTDLYYLSGAEPAPAGPRALKFFTEGLLAPDPVVGHVRAYGERMAAGVEAARGHANLPLYLAALAGWATLIVLGVMAAVRGRVDARLALAVYCNLGFQFGLHMAYGAPAQTFIYSMNYVPFFAVVAAWSFRVLPRAAWLLVAATIGASAAYNLAEFEKAKNLMPLAAYVRLGEHTGQAAMEDPQVQREILAALAAQRAAAAARR